MNEILLEIVPQLTLYLLLIDLLFLLNIKLLGGCLLARCHCVLIGHLAIAHVLRCYHLILIVLEGISARLSELRQMELSCIVLIVHCDLCYLRNSLDAVHNSSYVLTLSVLLLGKICSIGSVCWSLLFFLNTLSCPSACC